jgi:parallel beta-helix repeat protein
MLRKLGVLLLPAAALALAACSSSSSPPGPCANVSGTCVAFTAGTSEQTIANAVATATANTTFAFAAGTFNFTNTLTFPKVSGLKIQGAGIDQTILSWSGQVGGSGGMLTSDGTSNITFTGFTVVDTKGDGIKVVGGNGVTFQNVRVHWTNADGTTHGSYGIYPVGSTNVLVENCLVNGARDTGVYVGQSSNIIVRNNYVGPSDGGSDGNVSGIEIENSTKADVYGNTATGNTAGILVFSLPGLHPPDAGTGFGTANTNQVRVYSNTINANNLTNFGDPAGTVYAVPGGTGVVVLASTNVEVFTNTVSNNNTDSFSAISYFLVNQGYATNPTDPNFNPFPGNVWAHNNTFSGNGTAPAVANLGGANQLGLLLFALLDAFQAGTGVKAVPDLIWDGVALTTAPVNYVPPPSANPQPANAAGTPPNPVGYFISGNGSAAHFVNLNFIVLFAGGTTTTPDAHALVFNGAPFTVTSAPAGFPLPAVTIP